MQAPGLEGSRVLDFLLKRGWLDRSVAVDGDVQVVAGDGRHRHFRVERPSGESGLFVKQVKSRDPLTVACLEREAACCRLAATEPGFAALRGHVPALKGYDPYHHVLCVELFQGAPTFTAFHGASGSLPADLAAQVGTVLGDWHRDLRLKTGDARFGGLFPARLPWILDLQSSPLQTTHPQGPGALFVANTLRSDAALRGAFSELARSYTPSCLIHGDLKWDNLLVVQGEDGPSVRFVDWEIADIGDPLWDVAGVMQSYLLAWLLSMPLGSSLPGAQMEARARYPLASVQKALQAFWRAYADARALQDEPAELLRALRFTAGRLAQTTYESGVTYKAAIPQLRFMLELCRNTLLKTENAVHDLLGMPWPTQ